MSDFKEGDKVIVVRERSSFGFYKLGDILTVRVVDEDRQELYVEEFEGMFIEFDEAELFHPPAEVEGIASGFAEHQALAVALLESVRAQTSLLEASDGGAPSNEWAILTAMRLQSLVYCMTPEHRLAGSKIVDEFCQLTGVNQEAMERLVNQKTKPTEES